MSLVDLCEPLFLEVCRVNRAVRKGAQGMATDPNRIRARIRTIIREIGDAAATNPELADPYQKIKNHLLYFVDYMMREALTAVRWPSLAEEYNCLAGDTEFFENQADGLEVTLHDQSRAATERLAVFYTCLGLGFEGMHAGDKDFLKQKIDEVLRRLHDFIETDERKKLCNQAYGCTDERPLVMPVRSSLLGISIALIGLIVVVLVFNGVSYYEKTKDLNHRVEDATHQLQQLQAK